MQSAFAHRSTVALVVLIFVGCAAMPMDDPGTDGLKAGDDPIVLPGFEVTETDGDLVILRNADGTLIEVKGDRAPYLIEVVFADGESIIVEGAHEAREGEASRYGVRLLETSFETFEVAQPRLDALRTALIDAMVTASNEQLACYPSGGRLLIVAVAAFIGTAVCTELAGQREIGAAWECAAHVTSLNRLIDPECKDPAQASPGD